jgi:hypothetical protein
LVDKNEFNIVSYNKEKDKNNLLLNIYNHIYGEEKDFETLKVWNIKIDKIT